MLQMCSLITRDQNGYPLEGVDVVSDGKLDSSLSRLIGLLQEANKRADNSKDMTDTVFTTKVQCLVPRLHGFKGQ